MSNNANGNCKLDEDIPGTNRGFVTEYKVKPTSTISGGCGLDWEWLTVNRPVVNHNYVALALHPRDGPTNKQQGIDNGFNCGRCIRGSYRV